MAGPRGMAGPRVGRPAVMLPPAAGRRAVFTSGRFNHGSNPFFRHPFFGGHRFGGHHFRNRFCFSDPFCRGAFFHHGFFNRFDSFGAFPFFYGLPVVSYDFADTSYAAAPENDYAITQLANELQNERLRRQELEDEVARLQQSASPPPPPPAAPDPESAERPIPAVLVFRNGTRADVENYAIVGRTLFAFLEHGTRKIQIADLDLPATEKANEARGIDFRLPRPGQLTTHP